MVLAVALAAGLAGCTDAVEDAGTKAMHDKSTEVAQVAETKAEETEPATEIYAKTDDPVMQKSEAKKETSKPQEPKKQENKPVETKATKPTPQASKPVHTHSSRCA